MTMTMSVDDDFGDLYPDLDICDVKSLRGIGSLYRIYEEDSEFPAPVCKNGTEKEHMPAPKDTKTVETDAEEVAITDTGVEAGDSAPCTEVLQAECDYNDSDSEDDIKILLNPIKKSSQVSVTGESEDDGDDLIILAGNERAHHREELTRLNEDNGLVGEEKGQTTKSTGVLVGAQRIGFGVHPYYRKYQYVRAGGSSTRVVYRNKIISQKTPRISWGNGASRVGFEYHLPSNKTVFDIDIESFEEKPWRHPSADVSDYFNFGFDEQSWTAYCKQMALLRSGRITLHKNKINISGSGEDSNNDLLPESLGTSERSSVDISAKVDLNIDPTARAIQVEAGLSERLPSSDTRGRQFRESNAIYLVDLVDDPSEKRADSEAEPDMDGQCRVSDQSKRACRSLPCNGWEKKGPAWLEGPAACRHKVPGPPTPPGKIPTQEGRNTDRGESHSSSLNDDAQVIHDNEETKNFHGRQHSCFKKILDRERGISSDSKYASMKKKQGIIISNKKKNMLRNEIGKQSPITVLNADAMHMEDRRMPNDSKCQKVKPALRELCDEKHKNCKHKLEEVKKSQRCEAKVKRKSEGLTLISECVQKSKTDDTERVLVDGNQGIRNKLVKCFLAKSKNRLQKKPKVMLTKDNKHPSAAICNTLRNVSMQCLKSGKTLDNCGDLNVSTNVEDKEYHLSYCKEMVRRKRSCSSKIMQVLRSSKDDAHVMAVSKDAKMPGYSCIEPHARTFSGEANFQGHVRIQNVHKLSDVTARGNAVSESSPFIKMEKDTSKPECQIKKRHKKQKCKKRHKCVSKKHEHIAADGSVSVQDEIAAGGNISVQNKQNTNPKTVSSSEILSDENENSSQMRELNDEQVNLDHHQLGSLTVLNEFPGKPCRKDEDVLLRHSDSESDWTVSDEGSRKRGRSKFERWATHSEVNGSTGDRINLCMKKQSNRKNKTVKNSISLALEDKNIMHTRTIEKASQYQAPQEFTQSMQGIDELVAKWEKRRERFKLWMADQRENNSVQRERLEEGARRPLRKRRWNGGG